MHAVNTADRLVLRRQMRKLRAAIAPAAQQIAARRVARHIDLAHLLKPGARIAVYAAMADELSTAPLLSLLARRGAQVFMPRIEDTRRRRMSFAPLGNRWRMNRFGIAEPAGHQRQAAQFLNIVFLPLLAFDDSGTRLGMGGGYYDRALAFRLRRRRWSGPRFIGMAFDCQSAAAIAREAHDVQLDAIVTPQGIRWFSSLGSAT